MELLASDILGEQLSARHILKRIFESRKLTEPTSHPLYSYRITLEEYQDLKRTLRYSQQDQKSHKPGREWCAVFTLFVSEWFRREYRVVGVGGLYMMNWAFNLWMIFAMWFSKA